MIGMLPVAVSIDRSVHQQTLTGWRMDDEVVEWKEEDSHYTIYWFREWISSEPKIINHADNLNISLPIGALSSNVVLKVIWPHQMDQIFILLWIYLPINYFSWPTLIPTTFTYNVNKLIELCNPPCPPFARHFVNVPLQSIRNLYPYLTNTIDHHHSPIKIITFAFVHRFLFHCRHVHQAFMTEGYHCHLPPKQQLMLITI